MFQERAQRGGKNDWFTSLQVIHFKCHILNYYDWIDFVSEEVLLIVSDYGEHVFLFLFLKISRFDLWGIFFKNNNFKASFDVVEASFFCLFF